MTFENYGLIQGLSMIVAILFFVILLILIFKRPKNYYKEASELPLKEDND